MPQKPRAKDALPAEAQDVLLELGRQIKTARAVRGLRQGDLARKCFISPRTLSRLENGDPAVSLSVLASVLWALGLSENLLFLAPAESDPIARQHLRSVSPQRARQQSADDLDF